jgi:hypothetical protein
MNHNIDPVNIIYTIAHMHELQLAHTLLFVTDQFGDDPLFAPSFLKKRRVCSLLGVNEGVTPRSQSSLLGPSTPLGANFIP